MAAFGPESTTDDVLEGIDLTDLASVRAFADGFLEDHPTLDVLIADAGIMACPYGTTVDGFELQFGTNHLGDPARADALWALSERLER